jgi:hypothetical protein
MLSARDRHSQALARYPSTAFMAHHQDGPPSDYKILNPDRTALFPAGLRALAPFNPRWPLLNFVVAPFKELSHYKAPKDALEYRIVDDVDDVDDSRCRQI